MTAHRNKSVSTRLGVWRLAGLVLVAALVVLAAAFLMNGVRVGGNSAETDGYILLPGAGDTAMSGLIHPSGTPDGLGSATLGKQFAESLVLVPSSAGKSGNGYRIAPNSDPEILAGHRLRVGDVILDMDQRPLDAERLEVLAVELGVFDAVEITFVREGQVRQRLLTFHR